MKNIKLKDFLEKVTKNSPMNSLDVLKKCIELEAIENYFNAMYGVDIEITVKPVKQKREGRFYGKSILSKLN